EPADLRPAGRRRVEGRPGEPAELGRQGHAPGAVPRAQRRYCRLGHLRRSGAAMMRIWRRHRRARPAMDPQQQAAVWQSVSLLLEHPGPELMNRLDLLGNVAAELRAPAVEPLGALVTEMQGRDLRELQTQYVDTFDVTRKCSLHLTYFTDGDTRK